MSSGEKPAGRESLGATPMADANLDQANSSVAKPDADTITLLASVTLLERARDEKHPRTDEAWRDIDARYRPLITAYAQGKGLSRAAAETVAQNVMIAFCGAVRNGRIEPGRSPRGYLFGIASHKVFDYIKNGTIGRPKGQVPLNTNNVMATPGPDPVWENAVDLTVEQLLLQLMNTHFSKEHVEIWRERMVENRPSKEVASRHGTTVSAVDTAVSRGNAFLKEFKPIIRTRL